MNLLGNPEILCFLTILFIVLAINTTGFLSVLWGSCGIISVGILWGWIIVEDSDDEF